MVPVVDNCHDKTAQKCLFCVQWCYNLFKRFIYLERAYSLIKNQVSVVPANPSFHIYKLMQASCHKGDLNFAIIQPQ